MTGNDHKSVFIITGETGSGKTTFLLNLVEQLRMNSLSIAGFAAVSVPEDGPSGSFNLLDLVSGKILPLASRRISKGWEKHGNFYFNPEGIRMGKNILEDPLISGHDLIVVDEIGPFEVEGKIWAAPLTRLLAGQCCSFLLVVREPLVAQVVKRWDLKDAVIIDIGNTETGRAAATILSRTVR